MDDFEKEPNCYCSFCGKNQEEVAKLIAGPEVFICDECIDLCNEIVKDEEAASSSDEEALRQGALKPMDIKAHLDDYVIGQDYAKRFSLLQYIITIKELMLPFLMIWLSFKNQILFLLDQLAVERHWLPRPLREF